MSATSYEKSVVLASFSYCLGNKISLLCRISHYHVPGWAYERFILQSISCLNFLFSSIVLCLMKKKGLYMVIDCFSVEIINLLLSRFCRIAFSYF